MMATYARIYNGEVAEIFVTDGDISKMFNAALIWVDVTSVTPQPQVGWTATVAGSGWTFAAPASVTASPTLAQQAAALIAGGLTITSSGTLTLSAVTFATAGAAQAKVNAIATGIAVTSSFPGGAATWYLLKQDGTLAEGLTVAQYKALAIAILDFVAQCDLCIDGAAGAILPASAVTITTA